MSDSIMQYDRRCYISGRTDNLHRHHIFYGFGVRQLSEDFGCWCYLTADLHNMTNFSVHGKNGHELDMMLKRDCQKKFEELYGHDKFMEVFKKNYL